MSSNVYFDNISKYLPTLAEQISYANTLGLTDKAVHAENLMAELLIKPSAGS